MSGNWEKGENSMENIMDGIQLNIFTKYLSELCEKCHYVVN